MRRLLALVALVGCTSCIVSTHEGLGRPPIVPLPPEEEKPVQAAPVVPQGGPLEITASHILISYKGALRVAPYIDRSKDAALALAQKLREQALAGEDFGELAKKNSDDRGSAAAGGSLGTFRREQMVPEFSAAAFGLEVGDISDIVESPYGFHIIRRDADESVDPPPASE